jgi:AcrR family transcriptional regulator
MEQRAPAVADAKAPTGRAAKAAVRREQLLSTALGLFTAHGYVATSTKRIAEVAGVTEGLVFHYFDSKEALLLELVSRQSTFAGRIRMRVEQASKGTARDLFHAIAAGFSDVTPEEAALVTLVNAEASTHPMLRGPITLGTERILGQVVRRLEARVRAGELRRGARLDATALGFFGGFSFFFAQNRDVSAKAWRDAASTFAEAWAEQCWRGIATPAAIRARSGKEKRR